MSRVGKRPIRLPAGVSVSVGDDVTVKGPKGQLSRAVVDMVEVAVEGGLVVLTRQDDSRTARANHGLMRALVQNMVTGVSKGFTKNLEVIGTGYRAEVRGRSLVLNLGYSHPIDFPIPQGIDIAVDKGGKVAVSGADNQLVGQVAANIRAFRKPDSYKGKGIRYEGERIRIKAGKSA